MHLSVVQRQLCLTSARALHCSLVELVLSVFHGCGGTVLSCADAKPWGMRNITSMYETAFLCLQSGLSPIVPTGVVSGRQAVVSVEKITF